MISKNSVGLAGEFAVLSQLALRGFDANLTLGNTKGVDVLVSNPETGKMRRLEVKTHSNNKPYNNKDFGRVVGQWTMTEKHETIIDKDLFYCFVTIDAEDNHFDFYVVPSKVVADFIKNSHQYWLATDSKRNDNPRRAFQLGSRKYKYEFKIPMSEQYEGKWNLLG